MYPDILRITKLGLSLILIALCSTGWGGKIIYPWNATTAIVKAGGGIEVWFDADENQDLTSILLRGPSPSRYLFPLFTEQRGSWVYDTVSSNTYSFQDNHHGAGE